MKDKCFAVNEYTFDMWKRKLNVAISELTDGSLGHSGVGSILQSFGMIVGNQKPIPLEHTGESFNKGEIVVSLGIDFTIDYALPQIWVNDVEHKIGINPCPHFVWSYKEGNGCPLPITDKGKVILEAYNHVIENR